jgi:hypothetical protein
MNKKQLILSIKQAQKVCNEMNKCTNKFILQDSINEINEAINYTRCCEELKDKETPTFDKWLKKLKWKQIGSSYTFKRGESYTDAESLLRSYKKEYYNL